ncbi:MAG: zinc transport system ATP-binding protein [Pseudomonadota bacterium]|jgi:zinc transport system ATP-binding protein
MTSVSPTPLIDIKNLTLKFDERVILSHVSFSIQAREIVTLVGPNGAGKSSLLRAILSLLPIYSGNIKKKPGIRIGYMPQQMVIEPSIPMTVERFLYLAPKAAHPNLPGIIDSLALQSLLPYRLHRLSGGERQRVLLARALANKPDLLVLDEPAQGADVQGQANLYERIRKIRDQEGCSILMVSHDLHMVMAGTDRVICVNGHICCSGSPSSVSQDPAFLALFGLDSPDGLAVYAHRHTHQHD